MTAIFPRTALVGLALLLGAWAVPVFAQVQAQAQEPPAAPSASPLDEAQRREMTEIQDLLTRAVADFESGQQGRSITLLDEIANRLETLMRQGSLTSRGREMLLQDYELRGRTYFDIGLKEKAAESFRALIQLQPTAVLNKGKVSPKIVSFFNSVKRTLVGYLAVSTKPAGARVTLNGEFIGLTDFFPLEVLAGEYLLEVSKEGHEGVSRTLSIAPRVTEALEFPLVRTAATAIFITEPAGVEVWIDGELRATTGGNLAPDQRDNLQGKGIDVARASARTEVAGLSPGSHLVEFRKPCFETARVTLALPEPEDYEAAPVRLEESLSSLVLNSDPPGGRIFLDGELMGLTPRELPRVCSGRHRVEVKHTAGSFIQNIVLAKDESLSLDCPIRPSLAFLGLAAESPAGQRVLSDVKRRLLTQLAGIRTLNFIPAPPETVQRALDEEGIKLLDLVAGAKTAKDVVRKVTLKLAEKLEVQGFLIGVLPEERLRRTVRLHLLAAGNTVSEPRDVVFEETASYQRFINAVDRRATAYSPWIGLITVDTLLHEGVPVLRLVPGGPAAVASIKPGDTIRAASGQPIARTAQLLDLVSKKKAKDTLSMEVTGPSGTRVVAVTVGRTPQEIPLNESSLLYNKIMMDLRQQVQGYPGTETAAFSQLNLAIAAMHFLDYAAAHDHLVRAVKALPSRPGLSKGTAQYYLGLALERLGYGEEALQSYRAAAAAENATLLNNDGPAVASLAAHRAGP